MNVIAQVQGRTIWMTLFAPHCYFSACPVWASAATGSFRKRLAMLAVCWNNPSDRKSTRLNSSHVAISYAVFCLKKNIDRRLSDLGRGAIHPGAVNSGLGPE